MELWILFGVFTLLMLDRHADRVLPRRRELRHRALSRPAAAGGLPAAELRHERLLADGHPVLHLCRRPDGARRHRQRIVAFAGSLVGHVRGGLGQVNIVAATLFGGISGSAVAEAAAVGGLMIPQMKARGYGADYAVNVTSMAALIALLLPPSHNMIIYSIAGGGKISIADLFTAGILPGLLLAAVADGHGLCRGAQAAAIRPSHSPAFRAVGASGG